ncbi:MAG: biotin/lipoyl-binding protein [Oscillospiraceae bacterium]|nr:biotin/lipoyl-binding protein [Oscillospiraceae bacterium]
MKYELTLNGRTYEVEVEVAKPMMMTEFHSYAPAPMVAAAPAVEAAPSVAPAAPSVAGEGESVVSPMPGNILKVNVVSGQAVREGDVLVILEAMKMENEIMAPKSGTVTQVLVEKGAVVKTGAPLAFIK